MAASTSTKQSKSVIDAHQNGEFPVVLGNSLKDNSQQLSHYISLKYNWTPHDGFQNMSGSLKNRKNNINLLFENDDAKLEYSGWETSQAHDQNQNSHLALIYDEEKSAFVLEKLSKNISLNLNSATTQSSEEIRKHRQLKRDELSENHKETASANHDQDDDEETPDDSNPFDFRHFLTEAREAAEKASHLTGSRTPVAGGRTPLSGLSSPMPASGRVLATTPQFRPTPVAEKKNLQQPVSNRKGSKTSVRKGSAAKPKTKVSQQPQPLSKERISDSDEDLSDVPLAKTTQRAGRGGAHKRNTSANIGRSPHIIVNDGGLEIDMGSPPPEVKRRNKIDPEVFRSQTGTPTFGRSSNRPSVTSAPPRDVEMKDAATSDEDADADFDDDVEDLELPSPEQHGRRPSKRISEALTPPKYKPHSPSPPPQAATPQQEEDDDDLAAVLEAALEQEDDSGVGLGINTAADEESEISEEE